MAPNSQSYAAFHAETGFVDKKKKGTGRTDRPVEDMTPFERKQEYYGLLETKASPEICRLILWARKEFPGGLIRWADDPESGLVCSALDEEFFDLLADAKRSEKFTDMLDLLYQKHRGTIDIAGDVWGRVQVEDENPDYARLDELIEDAMRQKYGDNPVAKRTASATAQTVSVGLGFADLLDRVHFRDNGELILPAEFDHGMRKSLALALEWADNMSRFELLGLESKIRATHEDKTRIEPIKDDKPFSIADHGGLAFDASQGFAGIKVDPRMAAEGRFGCPGRKWIPALWKWNIGNMREHGVFDRNMFTNTVSIALKSATVSSEVHESRVQVGRLMIVCDDAGFASVDRGIRKLVSETRVPVSAEYMVEQDGAIDRAKDMRELPEVSIGLHFELFGMSDAHRFELGQRLMAEGSSLGLQDDIREQGMKDARRQLEIFRRELHMEPQHISTHGNFNTDAEGNILPWWSELMGELFRGNIPPMQLERPYARHNKYSWCQGSAERDPMQPEEFGEHLKSLTGEGQHNVIEFVLHPADPIPGDAPIDMLFDEKMRVERDLPSAIEIINSGVITESGFRIIPVKDVSNTGVQRADEPSEESVRAQLKKRDGLHTIHLKS